MTEFTASNGLKIRSNENEHHPVIVASLGLLPTSVVALREFFQHERDEVLGRWRWPENPHYVAYARGADTVRMIDERTGRAEEFDRYGENTWVMEDAANAYFEAHPERKPWEDARMGEVWAFDAGMGTNAASFDGACFTWANGRKVDLTLIHSGRRIWPEDAS